MAAAERGLRGGAVEGAGGRRWAEVAEVCSLVKVLLGCGIFSLSGACAVVGDDPRILLPASALTLFFAATAGYTFLLLGRAAAAAPLGVASVGEIWAAHVSEESAWVPELLSSALTWSTSPPKRLKQYPGRTLSQMPAMVAGSI
ncbi:hypothetical protein T484DRAFT_1835525 [Baffinella frigidus]|nr:hypothetical protein T484DRAFT_1835525 [Cryptophyta sp. CCMP2293]